jgi:hypothetical protein
VVNLDSQYPQNPIIMAACAITIAIAIGVIIGNAESYVNGVGDSITVLTEDYMAEGKISEENKVNFKKALFDPVMVIAITVLGIAIGILFLCLRPYFSVGDWVFTSAISLAAAAALGAWGLSKREGKFDVSAESSEALMNSIKFLINFGGNNAPSGAHGNPEPTPLEAISFALAIIGGIISIILAPVLVAFGDTTGVASATWALIFSLVAIILATTAYYTDDPIVDKVIGVASVGVGIIALVHAGLATARAGANTAVAGSGAISMILSMVGIPLGVISIVT